MWDGNQGSAKIKVVGIGGGGGNAINNMITTGLSGLDFIAVNTDAQALKSSLAPIKLQIGKTGLGAGGNPEMGKEAALEESEELGDLLEGADLVFVTAGLGGGTGTGGSPVVSEIARQKGALTVGVVTKPFSFEGKKRSLLAERGWEALKEQVDALITIPNQNLLSVVDKKTSLQDAFKIADDILKQAVQGIFELVTESGLIILDFADVKTVMANRGRAIMGAGTALGENRVIEAAKKAISSPLLEESSIEGATAVLINFTSGPDLALYDVDEAVSLIQEIVHEDALIIFGSVINEEMADEVRVTVIATGFETQQKLSLKTSGNGKNKQKEVVRRERESLIPSSCSIQKRNSLDPICDEKNEDIPAIWGKRGFSFKDENNVEISSFPKKNGKGKEA